MPASFIRVSENCLQTPIVEYEHVHTGSRVGLVGMVHVAESGYYDHVNNYVAERHAQGAAVHYEMISSVTDEVLSTTNPQTQADVRRIRTHSNGAAKAILNALGLVHQKDGITYPKTWENHDADELDVANRLDAPSVSKLVWTSKLLASVGRVSLLRKPMGGLMKFAFRNLAEFDESMAEEVANSEFNKVILEHRNGIALNGLARQLDSDQKSDVVMMWGAGHLPGLTEGIEDFGYVQTGEQWLSAFRVKGKAPRSY